MSDNKSENKAYCIWCGAVGDKRSTFCTSCGKKMDPDENLLIDYLVSRTKSKFKSKAINTVYDALKAYLLSHLYGVFLVISVIAVVIADYVAGNPGVNVVSEIPENVAEYINETNSQSQPVIPDVSLSPASTSAPSEEDMHTAIGKFIMAVVAGDTETVQSYYLPERYGYTTKHQLTKNHLETNAGQEVNSDTLHFNSPYRLSYAGEYLIIDENGNSSRGLEPKDITNQLTNDGFITNEMVLTIIYYDESEENYGWARYIATMVYIDGRWYTAGEEFYNLTYARL